MPYRFLLNEYYKYSEQVMKPFAQGNMNRKTVWRYQPSSVTTSVTDFDFNLQNYKILLAFH